MNYTQRVNSSISKTPKKSDFLNSRDWVRLYKLHAQNRCFCRLNQIFCNTPSAKKILRYTKYKKEELVILIAVADEFVHDLEKFYFLYPIGISQKQTDKLPSPESLLELNIWQPLGTFDGKVLILQL